MKKNTHRDDDIHAGTFEAFPGIRLATLSLPPTTSFSTDFTKKDQVFEFGYILDGKARAMVEGHAAAPIELKPGAAVVHYLPHMPGRFEVCPGDCIQMLGVEVDREVLRQMLLKDEEACPRLLDFLETGSAPHYLELMDMEVLQAAVVRQILSCPFSGLPRSLFLQSKVLELLSLQLEAMGRDAPLRICGVLTRDEEKRIRYARKVLTSRMIDAPTLDELSGIAGLSLGKLKKGFKIVFGKTAYACLHEDRMARAHALLSQRQMNVSQVAWEVGYINVGHFSTAFRKQYGIRPKAFQMAGG